MQNLIYVFVAAVAFISVFFLGYSAGQGRPMSDLLGVFPVLAIGGAFLLVTIMASLQRAWAHWRSSGRRDG